MGKSKDRRAKKRMLKTMSDDILDVDEYFLEVKNGQYILEMDVPRYV